MLHVVPLPVPHPPRGTTTLTLNVSFILPKSTRPPLAAGCLLPAELGDLRRIEVLRLADNHFRGNVPMTMANLKSCKELVSE